MKNPVDYEHNLTALMDYNCLSYWLPIVREIDSQIPRTEIINTGMPLEIILDGHDLIGMPFLVERIQRAGDNLGWPCFLRTGQTSHKHGWNRTCLLSSPDEIKSHIISLVEFSAMASMISTLSTNVWVVLTTKSVQQKPTIGPPWKNMGNTL